MKGVLREFAPPLLSGVLLSLAFPAYGLAPLAWVGLAPLLWRTADAPPLRAALYFFLAGWLFHSLTLQWLLTNVMWAGGWAIWGQQLLCIFLALYWMVFGGLWVWLRGRIGPFGGAIVFACLWVTLEALQANLFSGFGWCSLSYTQGGNSYFLQWASLGGGLMLSFFLALSNALLALIVLDGGALRWWRLGGLGALIGITHGLGSLLLDEPEYAEEPLRIGLYQSNYSLEMKWDPEYRIELVERAARKSQGLHDLFPVDLFVWPEALILEDMEQPEISAITRELTTQTGAGLLTGGQRTDVGHYYNSAFFVNKQGAIEAHYDKIHLAPFGEYVPFSELLPFVEQLVPTIGAITPGEDVAVFDVGGRRAGPLICFEVLFAPMAEKLRSEGADFLVVMTNLAWFGRSSAIPQELELARVRAVETRLPLVHASNTGISGVFDPYGRFTPVDVYLSPSGQAFRISEGAHDYERIMQRLLGRFSLPEPASRPVPMLPWLFPWICGGVSVIVLTIAPFLSKSEPSGRGTEK